ncbi:MAG: TIGR00153 family protein [Gemmatimonadota bacterium]
MRTIHQLFGKSPFAPLVAHTEKVAEAVALVRPLFDSYVAGDFKRSEEIYDEISQVEHDADEIKEEIRDHLPRYLFLPVDRGDVIRYVRQQDHIVDAAEDVAMLITLRDMETPEPFRALLLKLVDEVVTAAELLVVAGKEMAALLESSFGGPEVDKVLGLVTDVSNQESRADDTQHATARALLRSENHIDPVSIGLWMHAIQVLGNLANAAENTGDVLRTMMARR